MMMPLLFFFLFSLSIAKFLFEFPTDDSLISQLPSCSINGVRTIHLPRTTQQERIHFRLFFNDDDGKTVSVEFFDQKDREVARLELSFVLKHVQINWNGFITPWFQVAHDTNHLELLHSNTNVSVFKLNGRAVSVDAFVPEQASKHSFKLIYDETVVPDEDYSQLLQDTELASLLIDPQIHWQAPISQIQETVQQPSKSADMEIKSSAIDYIVFDSQTIKNFQISSGQPLPKLKFKKSKRINSLFARLIQKQQDHLPVAFKSQKSKSNYTHFVAYFAVFGFIAYLWVLFYLSKMSSKPRVTPEIETTKPNVPQFTSSSSKSSSRTLAFTLPSSPPLLISTSSDSNSILKVSVPAAFNLADNRHILFPSKLRNFQK